MSDYDDLDDDSVDGSGEPQAANKDGKGWRRELEQQREQARQEATKAAAENNEVKKELAFLKAGIDLNGDLTPQQRLFVKAYDGDVSAEAVKAAAVEYGVIDTPAQQIPAEEMAAHDRFAQAAGGATVQSDGDQYLAAIENATSEAEVMAALAKLSPDFIDTKSRISKWEAGGGQNAAVTTPLS